MRSLTEQALTAVTSPWVRTAMVNTFYRNTAKYEMSLDFLIGLLRSAVADPALHPNRKTRRIYPDNYQFKTGQQAEGETYGTIISKQDMTDDHRHFILEIAGRKEIHSEFSINLDTEVEPVIETRRVHRCYVSYDHETLVRTLQVGQRVWLRSTTVITPTEKPMDNPIANSYEYVREMKLVKPGTEERLMYEMCGPLAKSFPD